MGRDGQGMATGAGLDRLAPRVEEPGWVRRSAGDGAKGPRVYDWARVEIRPLKEPGKGYWLLVRRSIAEPGELAYYVCFGPVDTTWRNWCGWPEPLDHRRML